MVCGRRTFINGKIFTANDELKYADSMIVCDGKIEWIGNYADMADHFDMTNRDGMPEIECETIDLREKRILPGFIDAHMHPLMLGEYSKQISCLPPEINSIEELIEEIKKKAAELDSTKSEKDCWIEGWGYDESMLAGKRTPNRYDLDRGCNDKPVSVMRTCLHIRSVNSKALEIAGITKDTLDPEGGQIDRDENGEPTGILRENARYLINPFIPKKSFDDVVNGLIEMGDLLLSQGIVAITEMGVLSGPDGFDGPDGLAYYEAAVENGFKQKIGLYQLWDNVKNKDEFGIDKKCFNQDGRIHFKGLKLLGDGSFSGHTAWVEEAYLGTSDCGMPVYSDDDIDSAIEFCKKNKCQLAVHAMGGRAIDRIVNRVYEEANWTEENVPSLRIEHVTEPSENAIRKIVDKGYGVATQPIFLYSEIGSYLKNLGLERTQKTYPIRSMMKKGMLLCLSTDAPATSWAKPSDPFPCIKCGVTRHAYDGTDCGQEEKIDIETAIKLYTKNAARVAGFDYMGQLREGYDANFIVLNKDIIDINPDDITSVCVEETYIEGERVYKK